MMKQAIYKSSEKDKQERKKTKEDSSKNEPTNISPVYGIEGAKGRTISFKIFIKCTNEKFSVSNFSITMKIRDLKALLEFVCGIPYNLQRLSYLDDGELIDPKEIQYYDIIDGGVILMDIWTIYRDLVKMVVLGDLEEVLKQGVSKKVEWNSPTSDYMFVKDKANYINERSGIALFIASHRGKIDLVKSLISQHGADINYKSLIGRTPVMIAVVAGKTSIIDYLLENNADIEICDINGDSAMTIAKKFNNKTGQHRLTQFKWKKRTDEEMKLKKQIKPDDEVIFSDDRRPHQVFDSSKKTWLKGDFMQIYMAQLVPQGEFSGTRLSAPKSVGAEVIKQHRLSRSNSDLKSPRTLDEQNENGENMSIQSGLTFDKWLAQKLKAKKMQKQTKKSTESQQSPSESREALKESISTNEPDRNIWMKDYTGLKQSIKCDVTDSVPNSVRKPNSISTYKLSEESNNSNSMPSARVKHSEIDNIYKGMSYEEWIRIRDNFLKLHNMM